MKDFFKQLIKSPLLVKYQILVLPLLALSICLLLIGLLIIPQIIKLMGNQQDITEVSQKSQQLKSKLASLESINSEQIKEDIETSLIALPEDKDIPAMIGQLLFLVSTNQLKLDGLSFAATTSQLEGIDSLQVQIDLSGEVPDLKEFMDAVKRSARITKIIGIEISGGGRSQIQAKLTLVTFFKKLPTSIGGVEQPVPSLSQAEIDLLNQIKNTSASTPVVSSSQLTGPKGKSDPFE